MVACHLCGEQRGPQDVITCNDLKHALQLNPNESRAAQSPFFCFRCVKERFGESGMREPWCEYSFRM